MTSAPTHSGVRDYLYRHMSPQVLMEDMNFRDDAPRPGERLPDFDLPTTDGVRFRTEDIVGHKPLLLVTGSFTCPMTASSNPILKRLYQAYGDRIEFVMLHVREAHPGERYEQVDSPEEKMAHARDLEERDGLPWIIAVDDPDGRVHQMLDERPNAAYLTDRDGTIVFRSLFAGDERALSQALDSVAHGERPRQAESTRRMVPMARGVGMMKEMVERSGPRAKRDIWRAAPPMAALAWVAGFYKPLPPAWRAAAGMATIAAATGAAVSLLRGRGRRR